MGECLPKILVVDDELSMREFLDVLLTQAGYDVSLAKNGKQALKMIQEKVFVQYNVELHKTSLFSEMIFFALFTIEFQISLI